ncbi:MAG TPA: DUF4199 domain-containing protein [Chitinophagaceae bacterium]
MEETKIMSPQIKGLLIALVVIILHIAGYFTGLGFTTTWYNWVVNLVLLAAIIFACVHFANQKEGFVTFGNVFLHGFKISAVVTIIMLVYTLLAFTVLFPDMKEKIFEMQAAQMEKQGMDEDKMEQATSAMKNFFWPITIGVTIFGTLIWGAISSLIGAAVAKKKKFNPLDQMPG